MDPVDINHIVTLDPVWETEARPGQRSDTRALILTAAADAFMTRGFAAATIDYVAEQLEASKGQIYHYYRSKSDLYIDVAVGAHFMLDQATSTPEILAITEPRSRLHAVALAHTWAILEYYSFMRVALEATQHQLFSVTNGRQERANKRINAFKDAYEQRIYDLIEAGVKAGQFQVPDLDVATKSVLGSLTWLTVWYDPTRDNDISTKERIAKESADFVIAGLQEPA